MNAGAVPPATPAVLASPVRVPAAGWFACRDGRYAITLPLHYPSLHGIGKHQAMDVGVQRRGADRLTRRRLEYVGMRLEVLVNSTAPSQYELLQAEVWSRRWNIGRLSVGASPWRYSREQELAKLELNGPIELVGRTDAVRLHLVAGRIERVHFHCKAGAA